MVSLLQFFFLCAFVVLYVEFVLSLFVPHIVIMAFPGYLYMYFYRRTCNFLRPLILHRCTDRADLNHRWAHMSEGGYSHVLARVITISYNVGTARYHYSFNLFSSWCA